MSSKNKGLLFNTFIITFQRVASAALGLITTPIVLNLLGVADYGLFTLIVGFVGALTFVNWSLTITTQRYVAFAIGENNLLNQHKAFVNSMLIHLGYGILIFVALMVLGMLFTDSLLTIPVDRIDTAKRLLILVSSITLLTIVSVPYQGFLIAHENFVLYALLNLSGSVFKLIIALVLLVIPASINKLEFYTELLFVSSLLVFIFSLIATNSKYPETKFSFKYYDLKVIKEMMSFMSWNVFGSVAVMGRNQGVAVMLNIFFGVLINAAYGIAMQINSAMGLLTQGIIGAISPKILKNAGSNNTDVMMERMIQMTKLSFLFASFFAIIFLNQAPFILKLWLRNVPDNTVVFCQMIILFSLSTSLSGGLQTVFNALGKIKAYSLYVSTILILNLPIAYLMFKLGYESYTIFLVAIFLELVAMGFRLWLLKKHITFSVIAYLKMLFLNCLLPVLLLGITSHYLYFITVNELLLFVITIVFMVLFFPVVIYKFSLDNVERTAVLRLFKKIKIKS